METEKLSSLLLTLYYMAYTTSLQAFRRIAMDSLRSHIPFDNAIWMTRTVIGGKQHMHTWYGYEIPRNFLDILNISPEADFVTQRAMAELGKTLCFGPKDLYGSRTNAMLSSILKVEHAITTAVSKSNLKTVSVLSLGRANKESPFSDEEMAFMQLLMPHLESMVSLNFETQIIKSRNNIQSKFGYAIVDEQGSIHAADRNFLTLMNEEWPSWADSRIPSSVFNSFQKNLSVFHGMRTNIHFSQREGYILVVIVNRTLLDTLSPREREIAEKFTLGQSYKEVARVFDISPETVRSCLRTIYEKLGIDDKTKLANFFEISNNLNEIIG